MNRKLWFDYELDRGEEPLPVTVEVIVEHDEFFINNIFDKDEKTVELSSREESLLYDWLFDKVAEQLEEEACEAAEFRRDCREDEREY